MRVLRVEKERCFKLQRKQSRRSYIQQFPPPWDAQLGCIHLSQQHVRVLKPEVDQDAVQHLAARLSACI